MSVNRYRQPVEEDQMMQMLRAECNKYGSPDSYSKLMVSDTATCNLGNYNIANNTYFVEYLMKS